MKKILLLILFFVQSSLFAQEKYTSSNTRAIGAYERSTVYLGQKLYNTALKDLQIAVGIDPNFLEAHYRMGDILKILGRYEEAKTSYLKVVEQPNTFKNINFSLAECYAFQANYDSAYPLFQSYSSTPDLSDNRKKTLAKYLRDCEFSIEAVQQPVPYDPINLGPNINTQYQEYLPAITADDQTIIFTRRANTEDFFIAQKNEDSWNPSIPLSSAINTPGNEGAQCISPDGQYLFFAGCGRADGLGKCDIYYAKKVGDKWSSPQNLGTPINSQYWESQPTISADGKTLYFVSDRKGGYGSYDIYKSTYIGAGKWSTPQNLGPNINTAGEEFSPFIHADNQTLYFCSDGWPGFGEKDIFFSKKAINGLWQKPNNLGYPINTPKEESSLFISNDGKQAYFASDNLKGYGGLDLYSFELYEAGRPEKVTYVKGIVYDNLTKAVLAAQVEIIGLQNFDTVYQSVCNASSGEFLASLPEGKTYALNVSMDGYLFYSGQFILSNKNNIDPFNLSIPLDPIAIGEKVALKNIFFESNSFQLKNESKYELIKLSEFLISQPPIKIEIGGHTDYIGDDKTNVLLSSNRAKSVFDYLLKLGVSNQQLIYKGYGKSQPIESNNTELGRAANRRTEIKIIEK
jgi:outer membrane protein OmpA-like peptidoglycan-associated protein